MWVPTCHKNDYVAWFVLCQPWETACQSGTAGMECPLPACRHRRLCQRWQTRGAACWEEVAGTWREKERGRNTVAVTGSARRIDHFMSRRSAFEFVFPYVFICLFLAALGPRCWAQAFFSRSERGSSLVGMQALIPVASLQRLESRLQASVVVARRLYSVMNGPNLC